MYRQPRDDKRKQLGKALRENLVGESVDRLVRVLADLLVGAHEPEAHDPGTGRAHGGEGCARAERDGVAGRI